MRFRTLEELVALGLLELKPVDTIRVERWLKRSRADQVLTADAPLFPPGFPGQCATLEHNPTRPAKMARPGAVRGRLTLSMHAP
jgi:hypothetical protein